MKVKQRVLALMLSVMMVVTYMPAIAFAGTEEPAEGDVPAVTDVQAEAEVAEEETAQPEAAEAEAQTEEAGTEAVEEKAAEPEAPAEEPAAPAEETAHGKLVKAGMTNAKLGTEMPSSDELVEQFFDAEVDKALGKSAADTGKLKAKRVTRRSKLNEVEQGVYDGLLEKMTAVAQGNESNTKFTIDVTSAVEQYMTEDSGYRAITSESLGIDDAVAYHVQTEDGDYTWELSEEAQAKLFDLGRVLDAVIIDNPASAYWFDGTQGYSYGDNAGYIGDETSNLYFEDAVTVSYSLPVAQAYRASADDEYTFNTAKAAGLKAAVAKVEQIVAENGGETDIDKLYAYKDAICGLTSYNDEAAADDSTPYGDPWQMIYVFDGDDTTNVVCEGYSKAFQYLCDKSQFTSDEIDCHTVSGTMGGGTGAGDHMWNILHMDDNRNYLADITNSDEGTVGQDGELFLKGYTSGSVDDGYDYSGTTYSYDEETRAQYSDSELKMSKYDYGEEGDDPADGSFSFEAAEPIQIVEGTNGSMDIGYYWDEETQTQKEVQYFKYNPDVYNLLGKEGSKFIIDDVEYSYGLSEGDSGYWGFFNSDGSELETYNMYFDSDQSYDNQWTAGNEYVFTLHYNDLIAEVPVTIVENPVQSISFVPAKNVEIYENTNGYIDHEQIWDEESGEWLQGEGYFRYYTGLWNLFCEEGNKFIINNDEEYVFGPDPNDEEGGWDFYNSAGETLDRSVLSTSDDQSFKNQWTIDNPGTVTINYMGQKCTVDVTIVENPVQSIRFEPAKPIEIIENTNGEEEEVEIEDEETGDITSVYYYRYNTGVGYSLFNEGNKLIINDDEVYTYGLDPNDEEGSYGFFNSEGVELNMETLSVSDDQSYENQWSIDHPGKLLIEYMGQSCEVPVTIIGNPIKSVSYTTTHEFIENKNGELKTDEDGNDYFEYHLGRYEGDVLTVNDVEYKYRPRYDDYKATDESQAVISVEDVDLGDAQYSEHWVIPDGETETTVSYYIEYMGIQAEVTATLKKNPVAGIEFTPANEYIDRIFEVDGNWEEDEEGNEYFDYYRPRFAEGDQLTVKYSDGRGDVTYIYRDGYFVNPDNEDDFIYDGDEDGVNIEAVSSVDWTQVGKYDTTVTYEGYSAAGPKVHIVENPIESISFSRNGSSKIELTEGVDSELESDMDDNNEWIEYQRYDLSFKLGDRITVNKTGGESAEYVYRELKDGRYTEKFFVNVDDDSTEVTDKTDIINEDYLYFDAEPEQGLDNQWKVGQSYKAVVSYYNREANIDVAIKANPVTNITFKGADGSDTLKLYKEVNGYWNDYRDDETGEIIDFFYYNRPSFSTGDKLFVTRDDAIYTYVYTTHLFTGEYYACGFDNISEAADDDDYILVDDVNEIDDNQVEPEPWTVGGSGYWFRLKALGCMFKVGAEVLENPVAAFDFSREGYAANEPIELTEGLDADINSDGANNRWFEYYLNFKNGDTVTLTDNEGGTSAYNAVPYSENDDDAKYFENEDGNKVKLEDIYQSSDQSRTNVWKADDSTHTISLEYFARTKDVNVKIVKNPVQKVDFERPGSETVDLIKNGDGYWDGDTFCYEIAFKAGDKLHITYDGQTEPVTYVAETGERGDVYQFAAEGAVPSGAESVIDVYNIDFRHNRDYKLVTDDGSTPYIMLMYKGMWADVPVKLVENTVESFEYVWKEGGDRVELIENKDGDTATYYSDDESGEYFEYWLSFLTGDILKVKYAGTDEPVSYVYENGIFKAQGTVPAGEPEAISETQVLQNSAQGYGREWKVGNDYEIKLTYLGKTFAVPVTIVKDTEPAECEHELTATAAKDATCEEAGNRAYWTCSKCGKYFSDAEGKTEIEEGSWVIAATGHIEALPPISENVVAATCTTEGSYDEVIYCAACHKELSRTHKTTEALGHDWGTWESISDTEHQRVCSRDANHVETEAHTWDNGTVTTPATEEAEGVKTYTCADCGATKTEAIPKLDHVHALTATAAKAATCEEAGNSAYWTCSKCGKYFNDAEGKTEIAKDSWVIKALGHDYGAWTPLNDDEHQRVCSHDASHVEKAAHTWNDGEVTTEPTETEEGVMTYTCTACGKTRTETLPPEGIIASGTVGKSKCLNWVLDKNGTLTISGEGDMNPDVYHSPQSPWDSYKESITKVVIESGVTSIGYEAFYGHSNLTSVTIPESVTSIADSAFYDCVSLENIDIPDSVNSMGTSVFCGCSKLKSITIPNGVKSVGEYGFAYCEALTTVVLPESLKSIGKCAFEGCHGLTTITIPAGAISIGNYAFSDCSKMTEITIPESVTDIGSNAIPRRNTMVIRGVVGSAAETYANDNNIRFVDINACDHIEEVIPAVEPTCTEAGATEGKKCSVCGTVLVEPEVIPALGHQLKAVDANDATFEKEGNSAYWVCSRCGKYFSDAEGKTEIEEGSWVIPKLTWDKAVEQTEGQIDDAGDKATEAETAAETSTDENDAAEAQAAAEKAVALAAMAEKAAEDTYDKAQEDLENLPADASEDQKALAQQNVENAAANLAVAKQLVAAANSTKAKAKKAAAKIASNKAEAAAAAAAKAANSATAEEFRKEAEEASMAAAAAAGEAEEASAAAATAAGELDELVEKFADTPVAEDMNAAQTEANNSAGAASDAAGAADTSSTEAKKSAGDAKTVVDNKAKAEKEAKEEADRQGVADKTIPKLKISKPSVKKATITAKWKKLTSKQLKKSKATKIEVWVCPNKAFRKADTKIVTVSKKKASAKVKGLKRKTKYFVKVRAIKDQIMVQEGRFQLTHFP